MSMKPSPLTSAERQKRYREKNNNKAVAIAGHHQSLLKELQAKFAEEIGDPDFSQKSALSRIIVEAHFRYCPKTEVISDEVGAPPEVASGDAPVPEQAGVMHNVIPAGTTEETPPVSDNTAPFEHLVSHNAGIEVETLAEKLQSASASAPIQFPGGCFWRGGGQSLVVKFVTQIERKEFLKLRGFSCDYRGDKSWSKDCADPAELAGLACTVNRYMTAPSAEQKLIIESERKQRAASPQ